MDIASSNAPGSPSLRKIGVPVFLEDLLQFVIRIVGIIDIDCVPLQGGGISRSQTLDIGVAQAARPLLFDLRVGRERLLASRGGTALTIILGVAQAARPLLLDLRVGRER